MGICFSDVLDEPKPKQQPAVVQPQYQHQHQHQQVSYIPPVKPSAHPLQYPPVAAQQYTYATMPPPPVVAPYGPQQYRSPPWATPVYQYSQYAAANGMQQRYIVQQQPMYPPQQQQQQQQQQGMSTGMSVAAGVLGGMAISNLMDAVIDDPL